MNSNRCIGNCSKIGKVWSKKKKPRFSNKIYNLIAIICFLLALFSLIFWDALRTSEDSETISPSVRKKLIKEPQCSSGFRWNYGDVCYHPDS